MKEMISRRSFLRVMGLGFGAAMLTACKTGTADSPADSPAASVPDPDTPVPFLTEDEFPRLDGSMQNYGRAAAEFLYFQF